MSVTRDQHAHPRALGGSFPGGVAYQLFERCELIGCVEQNEDWACQSVGVAGIIDVDGSTTFTRVGWIGHDVRSGHCVTLFLRSDHVDTRDATGQIVVTVSTA